MTANLDDIVAGKHVFVVGTSRSGSTVLYRLLAYHPEFAWFSQYSNRDRTIPGRLSFPLSRTIDRLGRRAITHPWSKWTNVGLLDRAYQRIAPAPGDGGAAWAWVFPRLDHRDGISVMRCVAAGNLPTYTREDIPEIRPRLIALVNRTLRYQKKPRFLAKRPPLCFAVPAIGEIFPNAKFIHIVRDGKASIVSRALHHARGENRLEWVCTVAKEWRETMRFMAEVEQAIGPERLITVRYEDYCADVRGAITRLFDSCELPVDEHILAKLPAEIRSTNTRRFARTPEDQKRVIMDIAGEQLRAWGYASF